VDVTSIAMPGGGLFIDPVATGDAMLTVRANALRQETDALLGGDRNAVARGNALITGIVATVTLVANATRNAAVPPGLAAWRQAYFTFRDTVTAMGTTQALPAVVVSEQASISGWKIPGTSIIVPWLALVAVCGFLGVAWYVTQGRGGKRG
jgi:hypothetical protein